MMYRPEGWKRDCETMSDDCECVQCVAYEAGADAMLEGLKKEGDKIDDLHDDIQELFPYEGYLVFIPEERDD